jgi:hypothetical protein
MPHVRDEDDDVDGVDPEGPDPSEMDYSDEPDLDVCPHCRKMIYDEAERCPHCGNYISADDRSLPKAAWYVIIVIALIVLTLLFMRM